MDVELRRGKKDEFDGVTTNVDKSGQPFDRSLVTPTDTPVDGCPLLSGVSLGATPKGQGKPK